MTEDEFEQAIRDAGARGAVDADWQADVWQRIDQKHRRARWRLVGVWFLALWALVATLVALGEHFTVADDAVLLRYYRTQLELCDAKY